MGNRQPNLEEIMNSVLGMGDDSLYRLKSHLDGLIKQRLVNEDDPSDAPES